MASACAIYREVTVPFSGEIYVRQQKEYTATNGANKVDGTAPNDDFDDLIETSNRH